MGRNPRYGEGIVSIPEDLPRKERSRRHCHNWYIKNKKYHSAKMRLYYRCCKLAQDSRRARYSWENSKGYAAPPKNPVKEGDLEAVKEHLKGLATYKKYKQKLKKVYFEEDSDENSD